MCARNPSTAQEWFPWLQRWKALDAVRETLSRGNEVEDGRTGHQCHPLVLHAGAWVYTPADTRALYPAHKHTWICSWPFLL